ncbi:beta strand repeat-containing protein [Bradyrhizobium sp. AZCC 2289]|uniref:beta strand repeat-containing protein n=1 Tax=Bradyrhizobium sp. AZCC 2289 TaxID=3117026 RepID=UPI002FF1D991
MQTRFFRLPGRLRIADREEAAHGLAKGEVVALRIVKDRFGAGRGLRAALLASSALASTLPAAEPARAQDATWLANPGTGDFNTAANWTPGAVPSGTAFFGTSNRTALSFSSDTTVGGWTFNAGPSNYSFSNSQSLSFTGAGIDIQAGSATITNNFGFVNFDATSTAGSATITNNNGFVNFNATSTAGSATITNNFGFVNFDAASTAGSATITTNSGGGSIMTGGASGGTARFILNGTGLLDISGLTTGGTTAGSIEGAGNVFLGSNNLAVGGNNLSTTFSGVIQDGGFSGGTGGSLTKTGSGTLTLSGVNTYTGATTVDGGTLRAGVAGAFVDNNAYALNGGTLDLNGFNLTMSSLSGTGGTVALGAAALTIDQATATSYAGAVTGTGSLTKTGAGTLTLSGANTYTGATTVDDGELAVSGSIASSSITNNSLLRFLATSTAGSATITNIGLLAFNNSSTAGSASITNTNGVDFFDTSTAGSASISNNGFVNFFATSTAGNATITNDGGGSLFFNNTSTAGSATITNNGLLAFNNSSTAGSASIITNSGGRSFLFDSASGGTARFILNGTGLLDISGLTTGGTTAGSIEGDGSVFLGSNNLAVGGNNLSTTFSGVIQDGGFSGGTGGSLTKTGSGTLTLSGVNTYTGATTVDGGTLRAGVAGAFVGNTAYAVNGGTLDLNGFNLTMSSLSGTGGTVALGTAALTIDQATDTSYAGAVTGTGSLTKTGSGTLTLSGANTYTGATTVDGGTLAVSGSIASSSITNNRFLIFEGTSTAGSASITNNFVLTFFSTAGSASITNNGALAFNNSSTAGSAAITNNFGGSLNFNNTSTAGSASITNNGDLDFLNSSTAGSATITTNSGGHSFIADSASGGTARFILNGTGLLDISGLTTGGTTAGSIEGAGNVFLGSNNLAVGGNNLSTTFAGVIQDGGLAAGTGGSLTKTGSGTLTLSGANTYTGGTTINAGTLAISADNNLGANTGGLTFNGGTLQFGASFDLANTRAITLNAGGGTFDTNGFNTTVSQAIGGTGALVKAGSGMLTLSGVNTYTGGTTVEAGTLRAGVAGAFAGNTAYAVNGGTLDLNGFNLTMSSLSGTGGTVALGAAALAIDQATATNYAGAVTGTGSLTKTGSGTLTLSGVNTYTGATTVNGGTLAVNSSITASSGVTVNNGGTLAGVGTVGNTAINSGGTLAAGNGIAGSSMNVTGSLALQSGAFYMVQINPAASSFAHVTGAATLGGSTVKAIYANGAYVAKQYTILTAGSVSGTFASAVETNLPSNFHSTLSYDGTHAYLNLLLNFVPPPGRGLSGNQQAVGNAIVSFFNSNGGIPLVYSALTPTGLTQASGEIAAGSQQATFNAMNQFMGVMTDPFLAGRGDPVGAGGAPNAYAGESLAYASKGEGRSQSERDAYAMFTKAPLAQTYEPRWSVWAAGFGGSQTTDGNAALGSNATTSRLFGTAVGADYRFSPNTIAGFALAGGGTNFSVTGGGSGRSDLFQAGAFVHHTVGAAYLSGALAYGWQDVTTDRTVTIAGVDRLRAAFNANAYSGRVEGGYRYVTPWAGGVGLTPYAAGQFTTFDLPAYAEQAISGANTFALAYGSKSVTDTRSELGLRADKSYAVPNAILTLRGRLAWAHDFNPDRTIGTTFQALPGASFVVNGARQASDSALTTASAEMKWINGWSAAATFEGEFSNVTRSYAGKGAVRYAW